MKENVIQKKTFDFSLQIIDLYKRLIEEKEFVISNQLLRSATSIGANVEESIAAESRKDFLHKMYVANKEARETKYWLMLLKESCLTKEDISKQVSDIEEILKIISSITKTTKNNL